MENIYKNLINQAPFAFAYHKVILDEKNNIVDYEFLEINKNFEKFTGLKAKNIIHKKFTQITPIIESNNFNWIFFYGQIALEGGIKEFEYYSENLKRFYKIQVISTKKYYFSTIFTDITTEKEALQELEGFFDVNLDLLCITDTKGNFFKLNKEWENVLGYPIKELLTINFFDLIHPDDMNSTLNSVNTLKNNMNVLNFVNRYKTADNTYKYIEWNAHPIRNKLYCAARDITEQINKETNLKKSEENYRLVLETAHEGIFIIQNDKFVFINPMVECITGYSQQELFEIEVFSLVHTDDLDNALLTYSPDDNEDYIKPYQFRIKTKTNEIKWLEISATEFEWNGEKAALCFLSDITKKKEAEDALKFSESRKKTIMDSMNDLLIILDLNFVFKEFYTSDIKKLYLIPEKFLEKKFTNVLFPEPAYSIIFNALLELKNTGKPQEVEYSLKMAGKDFWFDASITFVNHEQAAKEILVVIRDITRIKNSEEEVKKERERLKNIIDGTNIGTWEWNVQTGEIIFNARWAEIIGYTLNELEPISIETCTKYFHPHDLAKSFEIMNKHFSGDLPSYEFEFRMKHKNGTWIWVLDRGKVLSWTADGKPLLMFGTHMDITERKTSEEKIIELSIRDPLTNIYNRRYIFDRLNEIKAKFERQSEHFSIAIIDIDFFKNVNDTYGHLAGDFVLQEFTKIIGKNIRPFDLLGRYGGEEFIIIMINCTKVLACKKIDYLLKKIRKTKFLYNNQSINFTFSCGISDSQDYDFSTMSLDKLIDNADKRLYLAKAHGRNRIFIEDEI